MTTDESSYVETQEFSIFRDAGDFFPAISNESQVMRNRFLLDLTTGADSTECSEILLLTNTIMVVWKKDFLVE